MQLSVFSLIFTLTFCSFGSLEILGSSGAMPISLRGSFPKNFSTLKRVLKEDLREIKVGYSLFAMPWVQAPSSTIRRDGLGPHFNAVSCMSCHDGMGRGAPPGVRHKFEPSLLFKSNSKEVHKKFGPHLSSKALPNLKAEALISITTEVFGKFSLSKPLYKLKGKIAEVSPRISPHLAGLGELEKIKSSDIRENLKRSSGKLSVINGRIARFGWKATQIDLAHQVAAAFSADMGITSYLFPKENCQDFDQACQNAINGDDEEGVEIREDHLGFVIKLMRSIAPPKPTANAPRGRELFKKVNCNRCHRESYKIDTLVIRPYTDLLLHDMGSELSDKGDGPNSRLWRTAPLWGIGSQKLVNGHTHLMHDGRARNVKEAILWHFGEARQSREKFLRLSIKERNELIRFVKTR